MATFKEKNAENCRKNVHPRYHRHDSGASPGPVTALADDAVIADGVYARSRRPPGIKTLDESRCFFRNQEENDVSADGSRTPIVYSKAESSIPQWIRPGAKRRFAAIKAV